MLQSIVGANAMPVHDKPSGSNCAGCGIYRIRRFPYAKRIARWSATVRYGRVSACRSTQQRSLRTMFERELTLYKFNLNFVRVLATDIPETDLARHRFRRQSADLDPGAYRRGHRLRGDSRAPEGVSAPLARQVRARQQASRVAAAVANEERTAGSHRKRSSSRHRGRRGRSNEAISAPHEVELLKTTNLKTVGDVLAHLMCTHEAFHVSQLSVCRRNSANRPSFDAVARGQLHR